jgi:hypothetical protein
VLEAEGAERRLTPKGSFTHIGKGKAGIADAGAVPAVFGIGSDAGQDVGEAWGSALGEV